MKIRSENFGGNVTEKTMEMEGTDGEQTRQKEGAGRGKKREILERADGRGGQRN